MASRSVAQSEVPLDVGAPHVVGLHGMAERRRTRWTPQTRATWPHTPVPAENVADRARRWHDELVASHRQHHCAKLLRAVERMLLPKLEEQLHDRVRRLVRARLRHRLPVLEASWALLAIPREPLAPLRATDPETRTEPTEVPLRVLLHCSDKSNSLVHDADLLPRHGQPPSLLPSGPYRRSASQKLVEPV